MQSPVSPESGNTSSPGFRRLHPGYTLLTALSAAAMTLYYPKRQDIVDLAQKM